MLFPWRVPLRFTLALCSRHPALAPRSPATELHQPLQNHGTWCTGEDSNLRSSGERQIYSLLPLTTRPPVRARVRLALKTCARNTAKPSLLDRCRFVFISIRSSSRIDHGPFSWLPTGCLRPCETRRPYRRRANILPLQTLKAVNGKSLVECFGRRSLLCAVPAVKS